MNKPLECLEEMKHKIECECVVDNNDFKHYNTIKQALISLNNIQSIVDNYINKEIDSVSALAIISEILKG